MRLKLLQYPQKYAHWRGTDALKLVIYPPGDFVWHIRIFLHRVFWKLFWRVFDIHYINSPNLQKALTDFGISKDRVIVQPVGFKNIKCTKKAHDKFTILFYFPFPLKRNQRYKDWIYGKEYLVELQIMANYNWIVVDGTYDMAEVYPIVDLYIKVNRTEYNDLNRIAKECMYNSIDVYVINAYNFSFEFNIREAIKWINTRKDIRRTK